MSTFTDALEDQRDAAEARTADIDDADAVRAAPLDAAAGDAARVDAQAARPHEQQINAREDGEDVDDEHDTGPQYYEFVNPRVHADTHVEGDYAALDGAGDEAENGADSFAVARVVAFPGIAEAEREEDEDAFGDPVRADAAADVEAPTSEPPQEPGDEAARSVIVEEEDGPPAMSATDVEALVDAQLRTLTREYAETLGVRASSVAASTSTLATSEDDMPDDVDLSVLTSLDRALLQKLRERGATRDALAERARAMARVRMGFAATRRGGASAASAPVPMPRMQLAEGSEDFPEDYDALQAADHAHVRAAMQAATEEDDFDPFNTRGGSAAGGVVGAAAPAAAAHTHTHTHTHVRAPVRAPPAVPPARALSPLSDATRSSISTIMSRIRIAPPSMSAASRAVNERVIAHALAHAQAARARTDARGE